jgi:hypothetical protein
MWPVSFRQLQLKHWILLLLHCTASKHCSDRLQIVLWVKENNLWGLTLYNLIKINLCFEGIYRLHLPGKIAQAKQETSKTLGKSTTIISHKSSASYAKDAISNMRRSLCKLHILMLI